MVRRVDFTTREIVSAANDLLAGDFDESNRLGLARLEAEAAENKQERERAEVLCRETQERQVELNRTNEELRQAIVRIQVAMAEQQQLQRQKAEPSLTVTSISFQSPGR